MCGGSKAGSYLRLIDFFYHSTLGLRVIKKKSLTETLEPSHSVFWKRSWWSSPRQSNPVVHSSTHPGVVEGLGSQFKNNCCREMCSGSEAGTDLRRMNFVYHSTLVLRVIKKKKRPVNSATPSIGVVAPHPDSTVSLARDPVTATLTEVVT